MSGNNKIDTTTAQSSLSNGPTGEGEPVQAEDPQSNICIQEPISDPPPDPPTE